MDDVFQKFERQSNWIECDGELGFPLEAPCCHFGTCEHSNERSCYVPRVTPLQLPLQLIWCNSCSVECADNKKYFSCKDKGHALGSYSVWPFVVSTDQWKWRKENK